ncbi:cell division regulator GpsB [Lactobacillus psittaci]|uniref:Cell division initiation protein n=1 Tax=Lactobacillus psittaci DSM 15354 TaxID=1122152 RepID=A0A0R1S2Z5_9LACO|nr:cell division regulator GpsB [Lactobacillus psittaci]KRL63590.1 cell division initiation protein [Lactobacillus psittaci DSM 15354]
MADLKDIKLSSQDILKKQFAHKMKGYDTDEVDHFLDQIISDYETYNSIIEDLYGKIGKLQRELLESQRTDSVRATATNSEPAPTIPANNFNQFDDDVKTYNPTHSFNNPVQTNEISTNMELIQRVSSLERKVYNLEQRVYGMQNQ